MKELKRSLSIILQKSVLASFKAELTIFSIKIFFHEYSRFTGQQGKRETFSLYSFFYFHSFNRHLDISWVISVKSSPLLEQLKPDLADEDMISVLIFYYSDPRLVTYNFSFCIEPRHETVDEDLKTLRIFLPTGKYWLKT